MAQWSNIDFGQPLFLNSAEEILSDASAAIENGYVNEAGGYSRFPGIKEFVSLRGSRTYLSTWRNNLIATTDEGRVYRIGQAGGVEDVTGVPLGGGNRPTFAATEDELIMAAGGQLIRLAKDRTEILAEEAPDSTHVAFVDGYVVAVENFSGRFWHSNPGQYRVWEPLSVFTAEGKPDDLNAAVVTPYRELLLCGVDSIEQFERLTSGSVPFFRRWTTGEGLLIPYSLLAVNEGTYGVNRDLEFVRFEQQVSAPTSDDIGLSLEKIDNWDEAWSTQILTKGQKWIVLQAPHASNPYETTGLTFAYDFRAKQWSQLYGWDSTVGLPSRWPAWSHQQLWGRHFIGVSGGIAELDNQVHSERAYPLRFYIRTGHIDKWQTSRIDDVKLRLKRGVGGPNERSARVGIRAKRDNRRYTRWMWRDLGVAGQTHIVLQFGHGFGIADVWQFEIQMTDAAPIEFVGGQALVERVRR